MITYGDNFKGGLETARAEILRISQEANSDHRKLSFDQIEKAFDLLIQHADSLRGRDLQEWPPEYGFLVYRDGEVSWYEGKH